MAKLKQSLPYLFIVIFMMISLRYLLFVSAIQLNKCNFKQQSIQLSKIKSIEIKTNNLYKNTTELTWKDHNKEVKIGQTMYEVIYIHQGAKGYMVYLMEDIHESSWLNYFTKLNDQKNKALKDLFKIFSSIGFYESSVFYSFQFFNNQSNQLLDFDQLFNSNNYALTLCKPPCRQLV